MWSLVSPLAVVAFCYPGTPIDLPLALLCLQDICKHFIDDLAQVIWHMQVHSSPPAPHFPLGTPCSTPKIPYISFLLYKNVYKVNWYIFDQGGMYCGFWMRCRNHHYPSYTSCTLSVLVDIPQSKNAIVTSFHDILNSIAKETTKNTWRRSHTGAHCCPQQAQTFRQCAKAAGKRCLM